MAESLCRGCGLIFTGLTSFDAHHREIDVPPHVECLDPRRLRKPLEAKVRTSGGKRRTVWGFPAPDVPFWKGSA